MTARTARISHSINDIDPKVWNACATADGTFNPFVSHEFLSALEASGSATSRTGWQPFHLLVENAANGNSAVSTDHTPAPVIPGESGSLQNVLGVIPMYAKGHSQGEYVFDYAWADAWERAGGKYYPKLQISVPFTPATGRRVLAANPTAENERTLFGAAAEVADQIEVSSLHATFLPRSQWQSAADVGYLQRMDQQYHWHNPGYASFDEFLGDLSSKKRKNLKRERRDALADGIEIEQVTGRDLTEAHWDAFYRFYIDTGSRKWGSPYLTRKFFSLITQSMADHTLLIMCRRNGEYIAGALNFIGSDALYGRNWGCTEDHRFLHFETCYYQAIDFAIERGLKRVEAGAQGQHKVARGYLPQATYSAHWIRDAGFRDAVANFVNEERNHVQRDIDYIERHSPFNASVALAEVRKLSLSDSLHTKVTVDPANTELPPDTD